MNQTAKDVAADFRKSVINWLVVTIAPTLWAGAATATWWGSLLSLSEDRVSSIRYWLLFASATALIEVAWSLYIRTLRKIRSVEQELADARKHPHRFQDDCTLDGKTGMYRHTAKLGFFCVPCAAAKDSLESPMIATVEKDFGWNCQIDSKHFVRNPDYKEPPHQPRQYEPDDPHNPNFFPR